MNELDWRDLKETEPELLGELKQSLGTKVRPKVGVPRGYVRDEKTGTIYKLDTWLKKVRQGLVDASH